MKKTSKFLLVIASCLLLHSAFAQTPLHIEFAAGPTPPVSIDSGQIFSFNVKVRNDSSSVLRAAIEFGYYINDSLYIGSDSSSGFGYTSFIDTIASGDTTIRTIFANVRGPAFKTGPSVVVIWPIATGNVQTYAKDSLYFNLAVTQPSSINDIEDNDVRLWLINKELWLVLRSGVIVSRVRIFDVQGKLIKEDLSPSNPIPMPSSSTGIYVAEVTYNQNRKKAFRFYY